MLVPRTGFFSIGLNDTSRVVFHAAFIVAIKDYSLNFFSISNLIAAIHSTSGKFSRSSLLGQHHHVLHRSNATS
jgi:hypothetical protein